MKLTATEAAVLRGRYAAERTCTPEAIAERFGVTLGEVREAEKTALRKVDPRICTSTDLDRADLTPLETAVLRECLPQDAADTPEEIATELNITVGEVFEAVKTGFSKVEDPEHASRDSLDALGLEPEPRKSA